jgi:hypothetical protein
VAGNNDASSSPKPEEKGKVDKEKLLTFVEDLLEVLNFRRVILIAFLGGIGLGMYGAFENRLSIVNWLITPQQKQEAAVAVWDLSPASKQALQTLAKSTPVSFIAVSDVDLKKNRRAIRYYFLDDPTIKLTPEQQTQIMLPTAVFDYDSKNTAQMVAVLGNEFRCDNYGDTVFMKSAPELATKMPAVCRLAIPPFVGQFVGMVTVGLSKQVTKQEMDTIRLEVSRLAVEIYLSDVVKKQPVQNSKAP